MSIRLLQAIFLSGVYTAVDGATLSLSPGLEADLVGQGKAVWIKQPNSSTDLLNHAVEHSRIGLLGNPGSRNSCVEQTLPIHHPVMDPDTLSGLPLTTGNITLSYDTGEKERSAGSLKIAVSTAVTAALSSRVPLPAANSFGTYPKLNSRVHVRIKCSDWTKVTRLYINFAEGGGTTKYQLNVADGSGDGVQGMHSGFDSAWSNVYRTIVLSAEQSVLIGSPANWCEYNIPNSQYVTDGLFFSITASAAVNFWIDRIYSPKWPIGFVSLIGDGAYQSFRDLVIPAFNARGWRLGASLYLGTGTGIYPSAADLTAIAEAGHDVFPHLFHTDTAAVFGAGSTKVDVKKACQNQMALLADAARFSPLGLRWCQFLQNSGRISTTDMATLLATLGYGASRADVADPEYGVNPFAGSGVIVSQTQRTRLGSAPGGWCSNRGRYNRFPWGAHSGLATPTLRDTYAGSPLQKAIEFAANHSDGITSYIHQILPYDGTQPDSNNVGTRFWADLLADLDSKVASGNLLVLSPTEVERLTYWRDGEVYMRWDGEWVYRSDPTKIAF